MNTTSLTRVRRLFGCMAAVLLLAGVPAFALDTASLPGSVKSVEEAPAAGPINTHKPLITRHALTAAKTRRRSCSRSL